MIQLQFLNKVLDTADISPITINNLNSDFFSDYKDEFNFIVEHYNKYGNVPDKTTFLNKFPSFDVISVNESERYLVSALYEDKNRRDIAKTFNRVRDLLNDGKTEEATNLFLHASENISQGRHFNSVDIIADTSRYDDYVDRGENYNKYYISTGFKELDNIMGGWDREEELATIVARSGVGKTWVMLKIAVAAAQQGLTVGIYSGEMSEKKIGYRIDTLISHISNGAIMHGNQNVQLEYKKYIDSLKDRVSGKIKVLSPTMIDGSAGVNALRAFIEKDKLDILCVDQHSLLDDDRKGRTPVEKASNISKDLKNLQVMKKIPIIAVSQQNRNSTDSGLDVSLIAQSDRIGQDSTVVIFIEKKDMVMTLYLAKSRDSVSEGKLQYAVDLNKGIFEFIPTETSVKDAEEVNSLREQYEEDTYEEENNF